MTLKHMIPEDAVHTLKREMHGLIWFKGATLVGIGPDAEIEIAASSMQDALDFVGRVGARWEGYPVRIRRTSE